MMTLPLNRSTPQKTMHISEAGSRRGSYSHVEKTVPHGPKTQWRCCGAMSEITGGADMDSPEIDQPILQRPVFSWLLAWEAVHDGTQLDAYLRYRLRVYEAKGRKSFHPLPFDIAIVNGRI